MDEKYRKQIDLLKARNRDLTRSNLSLVSSHQELQKKYVLLKEENSQYAKENFLLKEQLCHLHNAAQSEITELIVKERLKAQLKITNGLVNRIRCNFEKLVKFIDNCENMGNETEPSLSSNSAFLDWRIPNTIEESPVLLKFRNSAGLNVTFVERVGEIDESFSDDCIPAKSKTAAFSKVTMRDMNRSIVKAECSRISEDSKHSEEIESDKSTETVKKETTKNQTSPLQLDSISLSRCKHEYTIPSTDSSINTTLVPSLDDSDKKSIELLSPLTPSCSPQYEQRKRRASQSIVSLKEASLRRKLRNENEFKKIRQNRTRKSEHKSRLCPTISM